MLEECNIVQRSVLKSMSYDDVQAIADMIPAKPGRIMGDTRWQRRVKSKSLKGGYWQQKTDIQVWKRKEV